MQLLNAKEKCKKKLLKKANVVGVGLGFKNNTNQKCIVVSVERKLPLDELSVKDLIPTNLHGYLVDVVEVGPIKLLSTEKHRPAFPGISIGHVDITAGTLGCLVEKNDGSRFILSNNHVLANVNQAQIGDSIVQPGIADGGQDPRDQIGTLHDFVEINIDGGDPSTCPVANGIAGFFSGLARLFGSHSYLSAVKQVGENLFDAALAEPLNAGDVIPNIMEIGIPTGASKAGLGENVKKRGRTTELTTGSVSQVDATIQVQMGAGQIATFEGQAVSNIGSAGGDSGSAILNDNNQVVGLLFAGGNGVTIFSPITPILDAFQVEVVVNA